MERIEQSFDKLADALQKGESITINDKREWRVDGWFIRFVKWIFCLDASSMGKTCQKILRIMDQIEREEIKTGEAGKAYYVGYQKVAGAALKRIQSYKEPIVTEASPLLKRRIVALKYRVEGENGGETRLDKANESAYNGLLDAASLWKSNHELYQGVETELTPRDLHQLGEAARYPEFAALLNNDPELRTKFFEWALRDSNNVEAFVEYPSVTNKLVKQRLSERIGRFAHKNLLTVEKPNPDSTSGLKGKTVCMLFEGRKVSILDEDRDVTFGQGNHTVKIKDVMQDMTEKAHQVGNFEVFDDGFRNWNPEKLGYWDSDNNTWVQVDVSKDEWWNQLPCFETITAADVCRRYNVSVSELKDNDNNDQWVVVAMAARETNTYDIAGCHGYTDVLIPDGQGNWKVYPWGKFSKDWPKSMLQAISLIGNTVKGAYIYPEPNEYQGSRQKAGLPFVITPEEGQKYMEGVKQYIIDARNDNLPFMLIWENCAHAAQSLLEDALGKDRVPNLFVAPTIEAGGPIFDYIKSCKPSTQKFLTWVVERILRLSRSETFKDKDGNITKKSGAQSPYMKGYDLHGNGELVYRCTYQPTYLHRQAIEGKLERAFMSMGQGIYQPLPQTPAAEASA